MGIRWKIFILYSLATCGQTLVYYQERAKVHFRCHHRENIFDILALDWLVVKVPPSSSLVAVNVPFLTLTVIYIISIQSLLSLSTELQNHALLKL